MVDKSSRQTREKREKRAINNNLNNINIIKRNFTSNSNKTQKIVTGQFEILYFKNLEKNLDIVI